MDIPVLRWNAKRLSLIPESLRNDKMAFLEVYPLSKSLSSQYSATTLAGVKEIGKSPP